MSRNYVKISTHYRDGTCKVYRNRNNLAFHILMNNRLYWIDSDGDKVIIKDSEDYKAFLDVCESLHLHITSKESLDKIHKKYLKISTHVREEAWKMYYQRFDHFFSLHKECLRISDKKMFKIYWIDSDGDKVIIEDQFSYDIFLDMCESLHLHILIKDEERDSSEDSE